MALIWIMTLKMKLNGMKRTTKYIGWAIILIICLWGGVNFSKEQVRVQMILNNMKNEIE